MLRRIKSVLEVAWRRCYDVSRASWKFLEEDVTTYQERLGSYLKKTLRRIKSVLEVTWRSLKKVLQRSNVAAPLKRRRKNIIAPPQTALQPPQSTPFAKVTTVPPLEGRRRHKLSVQNDHNQGLTIKHGGMNYHPTKRGVPHPKKWQTSNIIFCLGSGDGT